MSYQPTVIDGFGPLALPDDPEEVGFAKAIDLSNVDLDRKGRLRCRDGYVQLTASAAAGRYDSLFAVPGGTKLLAGYAGSLDEIELETGAVTATSSAPTVGPHTFAAIGTGGSTAVYIANGTDQIRKWTLAGGFTSPAGLASQTGLYLAVQAPDNRLVHAKGDRVWFSNPGAPETFGTDDWVDITPGDGEQIRAVVAFNDQLFVFKQTKFAVFYGNSVDNTGGSLFNYRVVNTGIGVSPSVFGGGVQAVATPAGVFFTHASGVYVTAGGPPEYVSQDIEPLYHGEVPDHYSERVLATPFAVAYRDRRVYFAHGRNDADLVTAVKYQGISIFDIDSRGWLFWAVPVYSLAAGPGLEFQTTPGSYYNVNDTLYFGYLTGGNHVGQFRPDATDDAGTDIDWYYQSGFSDLGTPEVKAVRQWAVWGSGTVDFQVATDQQDPGAASTVTLGSSSVQETLVRSASRGSFFSYRLSGTGPAVVNRLVAYVREARGVGARA